MRRGRPRSAVPFPRALCVAGVAFCGAVPAGWCVAGVAFCGAVPAGWCVAGCAFCGVVPAGWCVAGCAFCGVVPGQAGVSRAARSAVLFPAGWCVAGCAVCGVVPAGGALWGLAESPVVLRPGRPARADSGGRGGVPVSWWVSAFGCCCGKLKEIAGVRETCAMVLAGASQSKVNLMHWGIHVDVHIHSCVRLLIRLIRRS